MKKVSAPENDKMNKVFCEQIGQLYENLYGIGRIDTTKFKTSKSKLNEYCVNLEKFKEFESE